MCKFSRAFKKALKKNDDLGILCNRVLKSRNFSKSKQKAILKAFNGLPSNEVRLLFFGSVVPIFESDCSDEEAFEVFHKTYNTYLHYADDSHCDGNCSECCGNKVRNITEGDGKE